MDPEILREAHSGLRWLLIAVTLLALLVTLRSMRGAGAGMLNRVVMLVFRVVITLQWVVGVFLLVVMYPIADWFGRLEHILLMTLAMVLTHVFGGRRAARPLVGLALIIVVLVLVIFGVIRVEQAAAPVAA